MLAISFPCSIECAVRETGSNMFCHNAPHEYFRPNAAGDPLGRLQGVHFSDHTNLRSPSSRLRLFFFLVLHLHILDLLSSIPALFLVFDPLMPLIP